MKSPASCLWPVVTLALMCGCGVSGHRQMPSTSNQALVVLPGASQVRRDAQRQDEVEYVVKERYPAVNAIRDITRSLKATGWRPLPNDLFNPSIASSHSRGWEHFVDTRPNPPVRTFQWNAQWANKQGDAVLYVLSYRTDTELPNDPTGDELRVNAGFMSSSLLRSQGVVVPGEQP